MENIKRSDVNKRNKIRRKKARSHKIKRLAKIVLIACVVLSSATYAEIKFGNVYKLDKKVPIENSNAVKEDDKSGQATTNENPLAYSMDDTKLQNEESKKENYAEYTECVVQAPKKRNNTQIYNELKSMSKSNTKIEKIYDEKEKYPIALLGSLVNNPEMTDFVSGYLNPSSRVQSGFSVEDLKEKNKLILQWDRRWGYESYGNSIIAVSGCAPTCLAMAISSLSENQAVTPYEIAKFSEANGHYVKGVGTSWSLMTSGAEEYGLLAKEISSAEVSMKQRLDDGQLIICTMSSGAFTAEGHFILIYGYDDNGFFINDPNCVYRSEKTWSYKELSQQINNLWSFSKK